MQWKGWNHGGGELAEIHAGIGPAQFFAWDLLGVRDLDNKKNRKGKAENWNEEATSLKSNMDTPWKIKMEPENGPLEKENHFPNHHFQVLC